MSALTEKKPCVYVELQGKMYPSLQQAISFARVLHCNEVFAMSRPEVIFVLGVGQQPDFKISATGQVFEYGVHERIRYGALPGEHHTSTVNDSLLEAQTEWYDIQEGLMLLEKYTASVLPREEMPGKGLHRVWQGILAVAENEQWTPEKLLWVAKKLLRVVVLRLGHKFTGVNGPLPLRTYLHSQVFAALRCLESGFEHYLAFINAQSRWVRVSRDEFMAQVKELGKLFQQYEDDPRLESGVKIKVTHAEFAVMMLLNKMHTYGDIAILPDHQYRNFLQRVRDILPYAEEFPLLCALLNVEPPQHVPVGGSLAYGTIGGRYLL